MSEPPRIQHITSRDNPWLKDLRKLAQDNAAPRRQGRVWIEGDHLYRAAQSRGLKPQTVVYAESFHPQAPPAWSEGVEQVVVLPDALFDAISNLESPARMGGVLKLPDAAAPQTGVATVILDRVQDAGNVGSILRSAAAFGFRQVLALKGTAALWSPKVLRAGMGAHFTLALLEGLSEPELDGLDMPLVVTSSHRGEWLHKVALPDPCAWVLGHEGQGVSPGLEARASLSVRIAQPGGEESLNVAAAAAICLHASAAAKG
ncbi:TrmH family RNA methyltransferase [Variovorax sp. VNK109]|uniref:TrmH family RNA methyltransferase n=1 Tax=Variovorax sp. VNK109 TaxID=3400919 RepID=UPI003BFCBB15